MGEPIDFYVNMLAGNMQGLSAVSSLKSLDDAAAKTTANIQALEAKLKSAKSAQFAAASGGTAKEQFKAADAVAAAQSKLTAAQNAQASSANLLAAKRAQMVKGLNEQVSKFGRFASAAKEAGGPVGSLVGKIEALSKGGKVGVIVAIAVALAAVAAAGVLAAIALAKFALVSSDAARSSALLSEAATGSAAGGKELETVVDQLSNKIPQARQKTAEWARELSLANIAGRDMQRTLTTMGTVASAVGDQAAGKIKGIAEASRLANRLMLGARDRFGEFASLQGTGIKAADIYAAVAKSMKKSIPEAQRLVQAGIIPFRKGLEALEQAAETRFGPIVAKQMASLDVQATKLKENISRLFSGANIDAFLLGLKTVTDLFDTNTVTGYVLREVFTAVFSKIASVATAVFPYVVALIKGVATGVITTVIVARDLYRQFQQTFGSVGKNINGVALAFEIGVRLVGALIGSIIGLAAAFVILGTVAAIATAPIWVPFVTTAIVIYAAVKSIGAFVDAISSVGDSLSEIDLSDAASKIVDGFIKGLKNKIADVKSAVLEISDAVKSAFTGTDGMDMHSPSKVSEKWAVQTGEGYVKGGKKAAPMVERATIEMVPNGTSANGSPEFAPAQPSGSSFTFNNCTFGTSMDDVKRAMNEWWATKMLTETRGFAMGAA